MNVFIVMYEMNEGLEISGKGSKRFQNSDFFTWFLLLLKLSKHLFKPDASCFRLSFLSSLSVKITIQFQDK